MKKNLWIVMLVLGWTSAVDATLLQLPVNQPVPDGSAVGLASTIQVSGETGWIDSLRVELNLSGSYSGDLYAYLTHDSGFSVLLNRPGRTVADSLGYGDSGLNVRFDDQAGDIHDYRVTLFGNSSTVLAGPLTGTWAPDGRPASPFAVTDTDPRSAFLASFQGLDPNGDWTLFVADLSTGDLHQLNSWALDLTVGPTRIPDNGSTAALFLVGMVVIRALARRRTGAPSSVAETNGWTGAG